MKKRLIFEVEAGVETPSCKVCPFESCRGYECMEVRLLDCDKYDFSTLKFIGEESSTINKQDNEND